MLARSLAGTLLDGSNIRRIEDGPFGPTPLTIGGELAGGTITTARSTDGESWRAVSLSDSSVAQTAYALVQSKLWLPGSVSAVDLKMSFLSDFGNFGTYHLDVIGPAPRGPFDKVDASPTATYPSLWNHNANNETKLICVPDSSFKSGKGWKRKPTECGLPLAAHI